jgi:hypothetical protein
MFNEVKGLIAGCMISGVILILSLSGFIIYLDIPLDHLPIPPVYDSVTGQTNFVTQKRLPIQEQLDSIRGDISSMEDKIATKEKEPPSVFVAVILLAIIWFSGIFFSTFTRKFAEKMRDGTEKVEN